MEIDPDADTGVSWLPLAHDMGLFGCLLLTYWTGHPVFMSTPERFLREPWSWFSDAAAPQATVSTGPNLGLALAARTAGALPARRIPMRGIVVGGDHIDAQTLTAATTALGGDRLQYSAIIPAAWLRPFSQ